MFFKQLLVLCSILFNFSPTYSFTKPEKLLENYQKYVLKLNVNVKRHKYCNGHINWPSLCNITLSKLRQQKEYKNNLYMNYKAFNNPKQNKCTKIILVLPNNKEVIQFHMPCPGRPKILPAAPQFNRSEQIINEVHPTNGLTHKMLNESNPVSNDLEQVYDNYDRISIYPVKCRYTVMVLKKNDDGKYSLLEWYKICPRKFNEKLFTTLLPKSTTYLLFLNKMLYSMSDEELSNMSICPKNVLNMKKAVALSNTCKFVLARPEYGNDYVTPPLLSTFKNLIKGEYIHIFLAYLGNEDYRIVNVFGYRCEENPTKYRLLAGPNKNSLFVLEQESDSDLYFIVDEFIDNLSFDIIIADG